MAVIVPAEIWVVVLSFLRNPIPPTLSNPPRSALRQPYLCATARVCKLFGFITSTLLYTHVTTDNFLGLVANFRTPSKKSLLSKIRTLRIEYAPKGEHPTYFELFSSKSSSHMNHRWARYGVKSEEVEEVKQADCDAEINGLVKTLKSLQDLSMTEVFPRMDTLAIASICKKEEEIWGRHRVMKLRQGTQPWEQLSNSLFDSFLSSSGALKHVCIRDATGPLSLDNVIKSTPISSTFHPIVHFDLAEFYVGPISNIRPVRWVSEASATDSWAHLAHNVGISIEGHAAYPSVKDGVDPIDLHIYCSTACFGVLPQVKLNKFEFGGGIIGAPLRRFDIPGPSLSSLEQHTMASEMGDRAQRFSRRTRDNGQKDRIRWSPSADSPICGACGTGPSGGAITAGKA